MPNTFNPTANVVTGADIGLDEWVQGWLGQALNGSRQTGGASLTFLKQDADGTLSQTIFHGMVFDNSELTGQGYGALATTSTVTAFTPTIGQSSQGNDVIDGRINGGVGIDNPTSSLVTKSASGSDPDIALYVAGLADVTTKALLSGLGVPNGTNSGDNARIGGSAGDINGVVNAVLSVNDKASFGTYGNGGDGKGTIGDSGAIAVQATYAQGNGKGTFGTLGEFVAANISSGSDLAGTFAPGATVNFAVTNIGSGNGTKIQFFGAGGDGMTGLTTVNISLTNPQLNSSLTFADQLSATINASAKVTAPTTTTGGGGFLPAGNVDVGSGITLGSVTIGNTGNLAGFNAATTKIVTDALIGEGAALPGALTYAWTTAGTSSTPVATYTAK